MALTAKQRKLPKALQQAILKKMKSKKKNGKKKKVKGRDRKKAMSDRALQDLEDWLKGIKNQAPSVSTSNAA